MSREHKKCGIRLGEGTREAFDSLCVVPESSYEVGHLREDLL